MNEHNTRIPHSAFQGQTPDEVYFGTGSDVPDQLEAARAIARHERLDSNRATGRAWTGTLAALLRARGSQLTAKQLEELPGILRWAIDGWRRVRKQVYITQPRGGDNAVEQMIDMATPIPAFLRDRCVVRAREQM